LTVIHPEGLEPDRVIWESRPSSGRDPNPAQLAETIEVVRFSYDYDDPCLTPLKGQGAGSPALTFEPSVPFSRCNPLGGTRAVRPEVPPRWPAHACRSKGLRRSDGCEQQLASAPWGEGSTYCLRYPLSIQAPHRRLHPGPPDRWSRGPPPYPLDEGPRRRCRPPGPPPPGLRPGARVPRAPAVARGGPRRRARGGRGGRGLLSEGVGPPAPARPPDRHPR